MGLLLFGAFASGCRTPRNTAREGGLIDEGKASFYGPGLHDRLTASGERFDKEALTAAHRVLPFGTCVRVENVKNGRSVKVRINDRGPFSGRRVIDVSERAARELEMMQAGVAWVRLYEC